MFALEGTIKAQEPASYHGTGTGNIYESGVGMETLDFTDNTIRDIALHLSPPVMQVVAGMLRLTLGGGGALERMIGTSTSGSIVHNSANSILLGMSVDGSLVGRTGREILIGGFGGDWLNGGADSDILIANTTSDGSTSDAMLQILGKWTRASNGLGGFAQLKTGSSGLLVLLNAMAVRAKPFSLLRRWWYGIFLESTFGEPSRFQREASSPLWSVLHVYSRSVSPIISIS